MCADMSGCRWTSASCTANGAYYAENGAFYEFDVLFEQLVECSRAPACGVLRLDCALLGPCTCVSRAFYMLRIHGI